MPYGANSPWKGQDHARCPSSNTAIASFARATSRELGINPKTVAKWRKRATVEDMKTGPSEPRSTVLSEAEEAIAVAFRRHTLLPLGDCLYALQPSIPRLSFTGLHLSAEGGRDERRRRYRADVRYRRPCGRGDHHLRLRIFQPQHIATTTEVTLITAVANDGRRLGVNIYDTRSARPTGPGPSPISDGIENPFKRLHGPVMARGYNSSSSATDPPATIGSSSVVLAPRTTTDGSVKASVRAFDGTYTSAVINTSFYSESRAAGVSWAAFDLNTYDAAGVKAAMAEVDFNGSIDPDAVATLLGPDGREFLVPPSCLIIAAAASGGATTPMSPLVWPEDFTNVQSHAGRIVDNASNSRCVATGIVKRVTTELAPASVMVEGGLKTLNMSMLLLAIPPK